MRRRERVEPTIGGLASADWVAEAHAAWLPATVKNLIWGMGTRTAKHWHDDLANEHAITHEHLAERIGKSKRTVRRLMVTAVDSGWLVRHRRPFGQHQTVYHFTSPSKPVDCPDPKCAALTGDDDEEDDMSSFVGRQVGGQVGGQESKSRRSSLTAQVGGHLLSALRTGTTALVCDGAVTHECGSEQDVTQHDEPSSWLEPQAALTEKPHGWPARRPGCGSPSLGECPCSVPVSSVAGSWSQPQRKVPA